MTTTTKAGKECPSPICRNGRVPDFEGSCGTDACSQCHGIGWIPAPGDALTGEEAIILAHHGFAVEYYNFLQKEWILCGGPFTNPANIADWKFRVAPAQEEPAAMESVEEMCGK